MLPQKAQYAVLVFTLLLLFLLFLSCELHSFIAGAGECCPAEFSGLFLCQCRELSLRVLCRVRH